MGSRPRIWSSYTNIRAKDVQVPIMNSTEEISKYKENANHHYYSPTLSRRLLGYGYDLPEKVPKKDKKWSIGSLFRRKKKESESSSDEDTHKKGFLKRKKKPEKKKKNAKASGFDHVVFSRNSHFFSNGYEDAGIFSDPSNGRSLSKNLGQEPTPKPINAINSLDDVTVTSSRSSLAAPSSDGIQRKGKKGLSKVRAEARRLTLKHDTSSDEDSHCSVSSSRFKSDESLDPTYKDGLAHRKSRAARTERYFKRHSKDGEISMDFLKLSKSDADDRSLSRSPLVPRPKNSFSSLSQTSSISGLSTIPPSHGSHNRVRVSNSTSNPSYKPPLSMNDYNNSKKLSCEHLYSQRSISCDGNIHKTEMEPEVVHVQFPISRPNSRLRNLSLIEGGHFQIKQIPPPPPPRDPRRLVTAQYYENSRPNTFYFDISGQTRSKSFNTPNSSPQHRFASAHLHLNGRSTSEDYLPKPNSPYNPRPSSATPDSLRSTQRPELKSTCENFNYLTDKKPRSRKPIFIQSHLKTTDDKACSQKALDFWKQKEKDSTYQLKADNKSPQMFTCQTHVQTQVFLPSVLQNDINSDKLADSVDIENVPPPSPFKPIEPVPDVVDDEEIKRKSSNLEEALDELEAIYNSLRLGDEDLLERAEQRERDAAAKQLEQQKKYLYPNWNVARGALSDSSFSYEPFDSVDSPRRKRLFRKSQTIDRRADDMAFRKLNKERAATINDPQSVLAKVSYLNTSPVYGREYDEVPNKNCKEPDITLDDVVYRNVKFANSVPKVVETQPPFGIPLGPITQAANSDYLHAVPDEIHRPTFKPRRIPDLVKDDLAFRSLRKDDTKEALLSPDDVKNNNANEKKIDLNSLKKKRAVRSLSANIGTLMNYKTNNNGAKSLTDSIADAMEIARQVLREKENKISATRKAFLSDNENNGNSDNFAESRMNFLNSLKTPSTENHIDYLHAKPPHGSTTEKKSFRSPKELTPIPLSPLEKINHSQDSSLDNLLTALATEARETNERISEELKNYQATDLNKKELNIALSEIEAVSEQAKLCEKLLEGVVDSTDLMVSTAKTSLEEVGEINSEVVTAESLANVVVTRDDSKLEIKVKNKICDSDHDYENLKSDAELDEDVQIKCTSPFEEHKAELIASFQELKKNVDLDLPNPAKDENILRVHESETGEACVLPASPTQECACITYISNCDIIIATNSSDLHSSFSCYSNSSSLVGGSPTQLESLESLKSPKLVMESTKLSKNSRQTLENQSMILRETSAGTSRERDGHILDEKPCPVWYRDPATVAVACSYGIACAHQLASLDFIAILGLLFAVLSFIAALVF